jgi:hypothetical protein
VLNITQPQIYKLNKSNKMQARVAGRVARSSRTTSKMVIQHLMSSQVQMPKMSYMTIINRQRVQALGMLGNSIQMR